MRFGFRRLCFYEETQKRMIRTKRSRRSAIVSIIFMCVAFDFRKLKNQSINSFLELGFYSSLCLATAAKLREYHLGIHVCSVCWLCWVILYVVLRCVVKSLQPAERVLCLLNGVLRLTWCMVCNVAFCVLQPQLNSSLWKPGEPANLSTTKYLAGISDENTEKATKTTKRRNKEESKKVFNNAWKKKKLKEYYQMVDPFESFKKSWNGVPQQNEV